MAVFTNIEIKNFRGLDNLQLNELAKINVFVGRNNCGKSSTLEALFMLLGMSNPYTPLNVNKFRNMGIWTAEHLKFLFHKADLGSCPTITGRLRDGSMRKMCIEPNFSIVHDENVKAVMATDTKTMFFGLNIAYDIVDNKGDVEHHVCSLPINSAGILQNPVMDSSYTETISGMFLLSNNKGANTVQDLSSVIKRQRKQEIVALLKDFDNRISGIDILNDGIYLSVDGMAELMPLYMAGDGLRSFLDIILSIYCNNYNVVLIDEIDNGMHYTAHWNLWRGLLKATQRTGCQIFVTTHNLESLDSLNCALADEDLCREDVALYTISQTANGLKTYRNDGYGLQTVIDQEIEIRN